MALPWGLYHHNALAGQVHNVVHRNIFWINLKYSLLQKSRMFCGWILSCPLSLVPRIIQQVLFSCARVKTCWIKACITPPKKLVKISRRIREFLETSGISRINKAKQRTSARFPWKRTRECWDILGMIRPVSFQTSNQQHDSTISLKILFCRG